jgi:hypothetical protein
MFEQILRQLVEILDEFVKSPLNSWLTVLDHAGRIGAGMLNQLGVFDR